MLDVPAGGGCLRNYLNNERYSSVGYSGFDFSKGFVKQSPIKLCTESHIPAEDSHFDAAVCLAALHHVEDRVGFFVELLRTLKTGGQLLVGDVMSDSKEAVFLNCFVNDWNSLGHKGDFLCFDRDVPLLQKVGFSTKTMIKNYLWSFDSEAACHDYLRLLFALDKTPSETLLNNAIAKLGTKESSTRFHLHWSLGFIVAAKLL